MPSASKMFRARKVFFIGSGFDICDGNATTNYSVELAMGFQSNGFDSLLLPIFNSGEESTRGTYRGVRFEFIFDSARNFSVSSLPFIRTFTFYRKLSKYLSSLPELPSLIFAMSMPPDLLEKIIKVGRVHGVPVIYHLVEEPFSVLRMKRDARLSRGIGFCLNWIRIYWLYTVVLRRVDFLCCISPALFELLVSKGYKKPLLHVLPNVKFQSGAENGLKFALDPKTRSRTILYSGRINFVRDDFNLLLKSWKKLQEEGLKLKLEIYGSGPRNEANKIHRLIDEFDIRNSVTFHGFVERSKLEKAHESADAFLLLKADIPQNQYNFPTKLMDYLSYGKPVIMSRITNHELYFTDDDTALMVEPGSTNDLLRVLKRIATDYETVSPIGVRGSKLLKQHFDSRTEVKSLLEKLAGRCLFQDIV